MIPFDFDYYKPETIQEATLLYADLNKTGKKPLYYILYTIMLYN